MSPNDNLRDLDRHAQDFAERSGFTYTVLSTTTGDVIGCVYIYPASGHKPGGGAEGRRHASVRSRVRADCAALDPVLHDAVLAWVERDRHRQAGDARVVPAARHGLPGFGELLP